MIKSQNNNGLTILSLFDGMSVAQQALKELGIPINNYYASEIDPCAIATTKSNFPNTKHLGSVVGLMIEDDIDLLIGGSPCQDLSIAKKNREGLKGQRSGLFFEYVRIRDKVKPKYFILENVNSMPKEAKEQISEILGVEPVMINASLVSAQNRKRLFWVGGWNGEKYEQVEIPQPEDMGILLKDILEGGFVDRNKGYCLDANYWKGTSLENYIKKGRRQIVYNQYNNRVLEQKCGTLGTCLSRTSKQGYVVVSKEGYRKLTPTECLRLQSMPDGYFDKSNYRGKPISNTQKYKMCGNAFNCEVVKHIIKTLLKNN